MINEDIKDSKMILLTSKNEKYLEIYLNNLFDKDKKEKVVFFSMDKSDFYQNGELWVINRYFYKNNYNIKKYVNVLKK